MSTTVAELLVDTLAQIGVRQIFGVVGDALNPLTEAIRRDKRIEWVGVRHEEGAALAAAGQAKLTGQLAVCCGTTGPGANHLVAGLYEARKDHAPVLAISGGVPASRRGIDYLQENTPDMLFRDVAVYTQTIVSPEQAGNVFHQAIAQAYGQRGVAHLNIPADVIGARIGAAMSSINTLRPNRELTPPAEDIDAAAAMIDVAKTVAIFAGNGCRGAIAEVIALAEKLQAPVMHTFRAKDMLPYDHPQWIGGVGLIGGAPGTDALQAAELVLMLGTDYPYSEFLPSENRTKVIQIDERGFVLGRRTPVQLGITGSVRPALLQLLPEVGGKTESAFLQKVSADRERWNAMLDKHAVVERRQNQKKIKPQRVARRIGEMAADDAVIVIDTGVVTLWCGNWIRQTGQQRLLASFNNAAVGTSLGQANGIQALDRKRQVVVAVGDGGFNMLMGEFMTSVEHKLALKVVVFNNREWGLVHLEMEEAGLPAFEGSEFPNPDFAALAIACGAQGYTARTHEELDAGLSQLFAAPGPALLNVFIDPSELPSMPHVKLDQIWRFGLAKVRESMIAMSGG